MDAFGRLNLDGSGRGDRGTTPQASTQDLMEDDLFNDDNDYMDTSSANTIFIPNIDSYLAENPDPVDLVPKGGQNGHFEIIPTEPPTPDILARISQRHFQKVLDGYTHESLVVYKGGPQRIVWDRFCWWYLQREDSSKTGAWPVQQFPVFGEGDVFRHRAQSTVSEWSSAGNPGTRHNSMANMDMDMDGDQDMGDMDMDEEYLPGYTFYGTSDFASPDTVVEGDPDYMMVDDAPVMGGRRNSLH